MTAAHALDDQDNEDNEDLGDDSDTLDDDDEAEEDQETESLAATEPSTPAPLPSPPLVLTTRTQPGLIRGLAASVPVNGTTLLAITKVSATSLLVTIQPSVVDKEAAASAIPLQVTGSSEEIDTQLLDALAHFVPARELAIATAEQIANDTAAAAAHAKAEAAKSRTSSSSATRPAVTKTRQESLTVKTIPGDTKITVTDSKGKAGSVEPGKPAMLDIGKYTVRVEAAGYDTHTQSITLSKPDTVVVVLKRAELSLLG
jgi:PRTRC genetic system protein E